MSKRRTRVTKRQITQPQMSPAVAVAQANQPVQMPGAALPSQGGRSRHWLFKVSRYTRPDSFVFWKNLGNVYDDHVKRGMFVIKWMPLITESCRDSIAHYMAKYFGGAALVAAVVACSGQGTVGRAIKKLVDSETTAPVMSQVHFAMDSMHLSWFDNVQLVSLLALVAFGGKTVFQAWLRYSNASFLEQRREAIRKGAAKENKTILQTIRHVFNASKVRKPAIGKNVLGRLTSMTNRKVSTERVMAFIKDYDDASYKHIQHVAKVLVTDYLVERYAATEVAIEMIQAMKGDIDYLTAILKSRHLPVNWVTDHSIDPRTIVETVEAI